MEVTSEDDRINVALTDAGLADRTTQAIQQSLEIVRQRIDQVGVSEPTIQRVGADRILVQLPGVQDPARLRELLGSTAQMSFHMLSESRRRQHAGASPCCPTPTASTYPIEDRVALSGERLTDARAGFDQRTRADRLLHLRLRRRAPVRRHHPRQCRPALRHRARRQGAERPVIREPITGGSGPDQRQLHRRGDHHAVALLRAGALPAPLTVIEERTVGPDLGGDAIQMGICTGLAGFVARLPVHGRALRPLGHDRQPRAALHLILTFGVLSMLGATLTLPGIAGIVLGIGLAVDANVLINERIREESRKGISAFAALDDGFKRAYSTIVDANVTALIATACCSCSAPARCTASPSP